MLGAFATVHQVPGCVAIIAAYGGVSLLLFVMYWVDKRAAKRGAQRTAENTLHLFELFCGWPGALTTILISLKPGWGI